MKKIFLILTTALFSLSAMAEERQVAYEKLPSKAKEFISTNFPNLKVAYVKFDRDITDRDYEVYFEGGTSIEFSRKGEWRKIDCGRGVSVPLSILPEGIIGFLASDHAGVSVAEVDRDGREYELTLANGTELTFDYYGRFKYYDD